MAVPKQRHNKSRKNRRRGGQIRSRIQEQSLIKCPQCGAMMVPHRACSQCGYYRGNSILNKSAEKKKKVD